MKKITFLCSLLILVYLGSTANIVEADKAAIIAKNHFWQISSQTSYENISIQLFYTKTEKELPVYYIFNFNDCNGFVIIAAEDNVYPVLGYSITNNCSELGNDLPSNFKGWMDNYSEQINFVRQNGIEADASITNKWEELSTFSSKGNPSKSVTPLLSTTWNQNCYYNELAPYDVSGPCNHCYAGCVATAMSQIMKYHNYPEQGTGSHSYYHSTYGTLSANYSATTYNWTGMPNNVTSSNTSVATLLYHCGVSVDMSFGPDGSDAYSSDVLYAITNYFGYSSNASYLYKSDYSNLVWENLLKTDLDASRPVYYRGTGSSGGHAFVCDGYQGTNHFHFNWGWSGSYNGYFYLSNLNPATYTFTNDQQVVINFYPGIQDLNPPVNLVAEVINDNDVQLTWDAPGGGGQWIKWDDGVHNSGIGLTNGGTFYASSHWNPSDLTAYNGQYLTKISYYHNDDAPAASFVLKVWQGANTSTLLLSQDVTSIVGQWNEITLTTPVLIDALQELWFGYEVTQSAGEHPGGVDAGPAVQYKGDMFSYDASSWKSMSFEWGLDYNWNLAGYVSTTADSKAMAKPMIKEVVQNMESNFNVASGYSGSTTKFIPKNDKALLGYNVYSNNSFVAYTTETSFLDENLNPGSFEYCVKAVYDEGESVCSNIENVTITGSTLNPPNNLQAQITSDVDVQLNWEVPFVGISEWIQWDDGVNYSGTGYYANGGSFYAASRWLPDDLLAYENLFLSKINFFIQDDPQATLSIKVWKGTNANILLVDQAITSYLVNDWTEIILNNPLQIDASEELWFGYHITHQAGYYPAGTDDGPAVQYKGDMFSNDASTWVSTSVEYGIDRNWNLAGWVSSTSDGKSVALPMIKESASIYNPIVGIPENSITNIEYQTAFKDIYSSTKALLGYNIYRDNNFIAYTTELQYLNENLSPGIYDYCVKALYDEGESACSNLVSLEILDPNYLAPPMNLSSIINDYTGEVDLSWDYYGTGFYEDFDDGVANNWNLSDNRFDVNGGYLKMTGNSNNSWASAYYQSNFDDFVFEYEVKRLANENSLGYSLGAFIRSDGHIGTGTDNGYLVNVSAAGYYSAWLHLNGDEFEIVPWTVNENINTGLDVSNIVTIEVTGSLFTIYVNGNYMFSFVDNSIASGKVGVCTNDGSSDSNEVWWNYVSLYSQSNKNFLPPVTFKTSPNIKTSLGDATKSLGSFINNPFNQNKGFLNNSELVKGNFQYFNIYRNMELLETTIEQYYTDYLTESGTYNYEVTAYYVEGESEPSNTEIVFYEEPSIDLKVYLEGPYSDNQMQSILNSKGFIPLSQPYNVSPWNYSGSESVISIPNNVVDWVLVELRDAPAAPCAVSSTTVKQQAAFLLNNGSVVEIDGISNLQYNAPVVDGIFVLIKHRNHLDVMSANPISGNNGVYNYDFTTSADQAFESGQKDLGDGYGMYGGDGNVDGEINISDKSDHWDFLAGKCGYLTGDYDLNGEVQNSDKNNIWITNMGEISHEPTAIPYLDPPTGLGCTGVCMIYHSSGGSLYAVTLYFQWNSSPNSSGYRLYSSTTPEYYPTTPDITTTGTSASKMYPVGYWGYTRYFVVRAYNECSESGNSNVYSVAIPGSMSK